MKNKRRNAFGGYHPVALFIYLVAVLLVSMFSVNPVMLTLSLAGGLCLCACVQGGKLFLQSFSFYIPFFLLVSLTNPLFSHNGVTPLFFMNGNPVTLEAILYGVDIAAMIAAVAYWCRCYSELMTQDKFLYLFSKAVPKLSLIMSMAIRFIPVFKAKIKSISRSQKAMGLYSSKSLVDKLQSGVRVFSALVTWSLENAVDTAHSMKARGYGLKGRTSFSLFTFGIRDGVLIAVSALTALPVFIGMAKGVTTFEFYPEISKVGNSVSSIAVYVLFGALVMLPTFIEVEERIKWKYYISKI